MFCVSCGKKNEENAMFCYNCGKDLRGYHDDLDTPNKGEMEAFEEKTQPKVASEPETIQDPVIQEELEPKEEPMSLEEEIKTLKSRMFELENDNRLLRREMDKFMRSFRRYEGESQRKPPRRPSKPYRETSNKSSEGGVVDRFKRWYNE